MLFLDIFFYTFCDVPPVLFHLLFSTSNTFLSCNTSLGNVQSLIFAVSLKRFDDNFWFRSLVRSGYELYRIKCAESVKMAPVSIKNVFFFLSCRSMLPDYIKKFKLNKQPFYSIKIPSLLLTESNIFKR